MTRAVAHSGEGGDSLPGGAEPGLRFLFVHGSFHGAWCWDRVIEEMRARGVQAQALTLPGNRPEEAGTFKWSISISTYAKVIADKIEEMGGGVTLIGHSFGGVGIAAAAEMRSDLVAGLVYVTAIATGQSHRPFWMYRNLLQKMELNAISLRPLLGDVLVRPPARATLYSDVPSSLANRAMKSLTPQPVRPMFGGLVQSRERWGRVPRHYIFCDQDRAIPIALQHQMAQDADISSTATISSGHSPFLSMPEQLSETILDIVNR